MKPPVEHVKVSAKARDVLIKIKRNTGLEHWNEICRIALCRSLSNPAIPLKLEKNIDSAIDIEWKTFAGLYQNELAALIIYRAHKDGVDCSKKEVLSDYFRSHLERGIGSLYNVKSLSKLCSIELNNLETTCL